MILLHNIGPRVNSNYNDLREILACNEPLSFDGIYHNVFDHREALRGKDVTLFVMGDYMGKDNSFDKGMPLEFYCDWNEVVELCRVLGAKLGWHTWSHRNLCELPDAEVRKELTPPFPMKYLAYPYGNVDTRVARIAQEMGYEAAWSVTQGDNSKFQRRRRYLNW